MQQNTKLIDEIYTKAVRHVAAVLDSCQSHGISEILYAKDPSLEARIGTLNEIIPLMLVLEKHMSDVSLKQKVTESIYCFHLLTVVLQSAKLCDDESFEFVQNRLKSILNDHENIHGKL